MCQQEDEDAQDVDEHYRQVVRTKIHETVAAPSLTPRVEVGFYPRLGGQSGK